MRILNSIKVADMLTVTFVVPFFDFSETLLSPFPAAQRGIFEDAGFFHDIF